MAQNTMVWLLSKGLNDIATSGETPKFDIKWSLPIYDHLTDGTVMTTPAANPGPDMDDGTTPPSHNQSAPGDFNGIFYSNAVKYTLTQWPSGSGYTALTETSGWAKNPEWSIASTPFAPGVGENGNTKYAFGSVSSGSFVEGTEPTQKVISAWNTSDLYENVRYDGTSTEDPEEGQDPLAYAHYTVYLRCQETRSDAFIQGDIRFNKVLLFTDVGGEPVPVAMVCLGTPVALFADNQGQSNSLAISFQLGFNPNDTAVKNVSFDNLYWTKVGEYPDHEGDMRLFSRNKLVLGEVRDDSENPAFVEINDNSNSSILKYSTENTGWKCNAEYACKPNKNYIRHLTTYTGATVVQPSTICNDVSIAGFLPPFEWSYNASNALVLTNGFACVEPLTEQPNVHIADSILVGIGFYPTDSIDSVIVGVSSTNLKKNYSSGEPTWRNGIRYCDLIVGGNNNLAFPYKLPVSGTIGTPRGGDVSVIVGVKNSVWSGFDAGSSEEDKATASRTIILGRNNQVDNAWSGAWEEGEIPGSSVGEGEVADSYVLGSLNAIGNTAEKNNDLFNNSTTRNYVFGNGNVVPQNLRSQYGRPSTTITNRYVLGSDNTIIINDTATVTPDIYIFGSNNTVEIDADSNSYGNSKYVFGYGMNIESWEEFVVGHSNGGFHDGTAHKLNSANKLLRMGINQHHWSLNFVAGGGFTADDRSWTLKLPEKSVVEAYPDDFEKGTLCYERNPESGFHQLFYYFPETN